jgi:hypothetical protein
VVDRERRVVKTMKGREQEGKEKTRKGEVREATKEEHFREERIIKATKVAQG